MRPIGGLLRTGGVAVVGGSLAYDAYEGYQTGDYSTLASNGIVVSAFVVNPALGAVLLGAQQGFSITSTAGKANDEPLSAEYRARLLSELQTGPLKNFVARTPDEYQILGGSDGSDPLVVMTPGHQFTANPYSLGGGIDLLTPNAPLVANGTSQGYSVVNNVMLNMQTGGVPALSTTNWPTYWGDNVTDATCISSLTGVNQTDGSSWYAPQNFTNYNNYNPDPKFVDRDSH